MSKPPSPTENPPETIRIRRVVAEHANASLECIRIAHERCVNQLVGQEGMNVQIEAVTTCVLPGISYQTGQVGTAVVCMIGYVDLTREELEERRRANSR